MSAEPISTESPEAPATRLSLVHSPKATVSTLGFAAIVALLIAAGLAGVLIVSTSVGTQAQDLAALRREATELGYKAASLESQLQTISSANALALRATELGMVPNPYPAFINLADGSVTGVPTPVTGNEMPFLTGKQQQPLPTETPDPKPSAQAPADAPENKPPSELTASGANGGEQP